MSIEERLEKLDLKLARIQFINRLLVILGIGVFLALWFFSSGTPTAQEKVMDEVIAKRFVLIDENGKTRALLHAVNDVTSLQLLSVNSYSLTGLVLFKEGPRLVMHDENGKPRAGLSVSKDGPLLLLNDKAGKNRIRMGVNLDEPSLNMYSPDGSVIWQAP